MVRITRAPLQVHRTGPGYPWANARQRNFVENRQGSCSVLLRKLRDMPNSGRRWFRILPLKVGHMPANPENCQAP
jgi:hypothetical protein